MNYKTRKVPARFEYSTTPPAKFDGKTYLRKEFFAILDCLLQELHKRFTQSGLDKLVSIESILIITIYGEKLNKLELIKLVSTIVTDFDIDQLAAQLIMLSSILYFDKSTENLIPFIDVLKTLPESTRR